MLRYALAGFALLGLAMAQGGNPCDHVFKPTENENQLINQSCLTEDDMRNPDMNKISNCVANNMGWMTAEGKLDDDEVANYLISRADAYEGQVSDDKVNKLKENVGECKGTLQGNPGNMMSFMECVAGDIDCSVE